MKGGRTMNAEKCADAVVNQFREGALSKRREENVGQQQQWGALRSRNGEGVRSSSRGGVRRVR